MTLPTEYHRRHHDFEWIDKTSMAEELETAAKALRAVIPAVVERETREALAARDTKGG